MNNGRPPYGDPSQWGNQPSAGQNPAGQFVPVQQGSQIPPVQGGYPPYQPVNGQSASPYGNGASPYGQQPYQPVQTYQPQQHQAQQTNPQQTWQPYQQGSFQAYPQQGNMQGMPQGGYQMPQGNPQRPPQGGYQAYPPVQYPRFNQQGQQVNVRPDQLMQGYSGYYSAPPAEKHQVPMDVIMSIILFGVLPVLFVLGLALHSQVLNWVFLGCAAAMIAAMWLKDLVAANMRLVLTLVYSVAAIVALVFALNGPSGDVQNQQGMPGQQQSAQASGSVMSGLVWEETPTPSPTPTHTPDPYAATGAAVDQLKSFFHFWSVNNVESMVSLTAPSWRRTVQEPSTALWSQILVNRTPDSDYEITAITGTENDMTRTATVKATIDKHNGRDKERYSFKVIMLKEDGEWYVDPRSLQSHDKETPTQATVNTTPTQPPLYTGTPSTILYYNANGGSMYHLDGDCQKVGKQYKPMAQFLFSQLGEAPYNALRPCNVCGAPIPD